MAYSYMDSPNSIAMKEKKISTSQYFCKLKTHTPTKSLEI